MTNSHPDGNPRHEDELKDALLEEFSKKAGLPRGSTTIELFEKLSPQQQQDFMVRLGLDPRARLWDVLNVMDEKDRKILAARLGLDPRTATWEDLANQEMENDK